MKENLENLEGKDSRGKSFNNLTEEFLARSSKIKSSLKKKIKEERSKYLGFCTFVMNLLIWPLKHLRLIRASSSKSLMSIAFELVRIDCKETSSS